MDLEEYPKVTKFSSLSIDLTFKLLGSPRNTTSMFLEKMAAL